MAYTPEQSVPVFNSIKREFNSLLSQADPEDFIPRPKSLSLLSKDRRRFIDSARQSNRSIRQLLSSQADELFSRYQISKLEAIDLTSLGWIYSQRLTEVGAVFGDLPFNFSLTRDRLTPEQLLNMTTGSLNAFRALQTIASSNSPSATTSLSPVENGFDQLKLVPNAARIDLIQTPSGPKIIEINAQWVDAIAAVAGFASVFGSPFSATKTIRAFNSAYDPYSKLALIDIRQTTGTRQLGATLELQSLASSITGSGRIDYAEVIDPQKTRLDYLDKFNAFFVNCDPRYFNFDFPDWLQLIMEKTASNPNAMFPSWRPSVDKKTVLTQLFDPTPALQDRLTQKGVDLALLRQTITPTFTLDRYGRPTPEESVVIKGDGYSLNAVALPQSPSFDDFVSYALSEPTAYVVQPFLQDLRQNVWVYDTYSQIPILFTQAYCKYNLWIINDQVVGLLATFDQTPAISDRGYSTPPNISQTKL